MPDDPTKFAIIPCVYPPSNALLVGEMDTLMSCLPGTIANAQVIAQIDEAQEQLEAREADLTERAVQTLADGIARIKDRLDELEQQRAEYSRQDEEARQARETEEQVARITAALDTLEEHTSGGLTTNLPTAPEHEKQLAALEHDAALPEPSLIPQED